MYGNVIRNLVPLVITDEQLAEALDVLEAAIEHAVAAVAAESPPVRVRNLHLRPEHLGESADSGRTNAR